MIIEIIPPKKAIRCQSDSKLKPGRCMVSFIKRALMKTIGTSRKAIMPNLDVLEYFINRELLPEFGYEDLYFEFVREDIQTEIREQKLYESYLKNGQITINEWRSSHGDLDPVSWGDEPFRGGGFGGGGLFGSSMFDGGVKESEEGVRGD